MSGTNALWQPDAIPGTRDNPLAPPPTWADAATQTVGAVGDYIAQQRALAQQQGVWGPDGITPAGARDAATQVAMAPVLGTTGPKGADVPAPGFTAYGAAPMRSNPFNVPEPAGGRSLPADNYRKPLSEYAPTLYRQTSPDEAMEYVPGSVVTTDKTAVEPYFADHPSIALGQGRNKDGILMAFDPSGIHGQINTGMPAFEPAWRNGYGEYRGTLNDQATYQQALTAMRIPNGLPMSRLERRQMQNAVGQMKAAGWDSQQGPGYTDYLRPSKD